MTLSQFPEMQGGESSRIYHSKTLWVAMLPLMFPEIEVALTAVKTLVWLRLIFQPLTSHCPRWIPEGTGQKGEFSTYEGVVYSPMLESLLNTSLSKI